MIYGNYPKGYERKTHKKKKKKKHAANTMEILGKWTKRLKRVKPRSHIRLHVRGILYPPRIHIELLRSVAKCDVIKSVYKSRHTERRSIRIHADAGILIFFFSVYYFIRRRYIFSFYSPRCADRFAYAAWCGAWTPRTTRRICFTMYNR